MKIKNYDCIFIDRDGTINFDPGYINNLSDFKFFEFSLDALKLLSSKGLRFCIISNQSGVGRGIIKKSSLFKINNFIIESCKNNKINLIDIFNCYDLPNSGSKMRKPNTGMFIEASKKHNISLENSLMVGDWVTDIKPANLLGMDSVLVLTGRGQKALSYFDETLKSTYVINDISYLKNIVLN